MVSSAIENISQVPGHAEIANGLREALNEGAIEAPSGVSKILGDVLEKNAATDPSGRITLFNIGDEGLESTLVHEYSHRLDVKCGRGLKFDPDDPKDPTHSPAYMAEEHYRNAKTLENAGRGGKRRPLIGGPPNPPRWTGPGNFRGPNSVGGYLK